MSMGNPNVKRYQPGVRASAICTQTGEEPMRLTIPVIFNSVTPSTLARWSVASRPENRWQSS